MPDDNLSTVDELASESCDSVSAPWHGYYPNLCQSTVLCRLGLIEKWETLNPVLICCDQRSISRRQGFLTKIAAQWW